MRLQFSVLIAEFSQNPEDRRFTGAVSRQAGVVDFKDDGRPEPTNGILGPFENTRFKAFTVEVDQIEMGQRERVDCNAPDRDLAFIGNVRGPSVFFGMKRELIERVGQGEVQHPHSWIILKITLQALKGKRVRLTGDNGAACPDETRVSRRVVANAGSGVKDGATGRNILTEESYLAVSQIKPTVVLDPSTEMAVFLKHVDALRSSEDAGRDVH